MSNHHFSYPLQKIEEDEYYLPSTGVPRGGGGGGWGLKTPPPTK
jgi:hypothetical protein